MFLRVRRLTTHPVQKSKLERQARGGALSTAEVQDLHLKDAQTSYKVSKIMPLIRKERIQEVGYCGGPGISGVDSGEGSLEGLRVDVGTVGGLD